MAKKGTADVDEAPGCRASAITTVFLLSFGVVLFAVGLTLINQDSCSGLCETVGLTALYAGGPVSAAFGIFTDSVVIAWPLDVTLWVVLGFTVARWSENRDKPPLAVAMVVVAIALAYGLVLSQLVELAV
jgi:hypothetical protein